MLSHIHIRDFAIVERIELELGPGMSVLTGETGAGKSILIDALGLALGDRAESGAVRHGAERAEVSVSFQLEAHSPALHWLHEHELDEDGECQIRRTLTREGRSKAYINGRPATLQQLAALGELLVDIHGQHAHQSLTRREVQRELLDAYAGHPKLLEQVAELAGEWQALHDEYQSLSRAAAERESRLDLLRYQVQELEALGLATDELDELDAEHRRLANAGELIAACGRVMGLLGDDEESSAGILLGQAAREMEGLRSLDPALAEAAELVDNALIQAEEALDGLRHYADRLELDPERLQFVEERIGAIHTLARKHRVEPAELPELQLRLAGELADLEHADERLEGLQARIGALHERYRKAADKLSKSRAKTAKALSKQVSQAMHELGMPGGRFEVELTPREADTVAADGLERVGFAVSANPGQPPRPLGKVASGGELSRISLAIEVILADSASIPSLIFDEVDSGIGGGVAEVVGRRLRALGERRQVLCVTHLPQVAAQGHRHLQVEKQTDGKSTHTRIRALDPEPRIGEIARMLGGIEITEQTLAHAREMLGRTE